MVVVCARGLIAIGGKQGSGPGAARALLSRWALEIGFFVVERATTEALELVQCLSMPVNAVAHAGDAIERSIGKPVGDGLQVGPELVFESGVSGAQRDDSRLCGLNEELDRSQLWAIAQRFYVEHHEIPAALGFQAALDDVALDKLSFASSAAPQRIVRDAIDIAARAGSGFVEDGDGVRGEEFLSRRRSVERGCSQRCRDCSASFADRAERHAQLSSSTKFAPLPAKTTGAPKPNPARTSPSQDAVRRSQLNTGQ